MKYENAGTLEFIMDETGKHYFLEMNTRLQVEHPVSECINGIDLVKLQIAVASKEIKPWEKWGNFVSPRGHAIEVRVYAEDPDNNFMPTSGTIKVLKTSSLKNVRYDFTYQEGDEITINYDPMIGKVIAWGETRDEAIQKLIRALKETIILGFKTNISFLISCLSHVAFKSGQVSTSFINKYETQLLNFKTPEEFIVAGFFLAQINKTTNKRLCGTDPWIQLSNFRV